MSKSAVESYYTEEDVGESNTNFYRGILWIISEARHTGGIIAIERFSDIDKFMMYPKMEFFGQFKKAPHTSIINNVRIEIVSSSSHIYSAQHRPLLAIHPTKDFLDKIYSIKNISKLFVVPWDMKEIEEWVQYSNAKKYGVDNLSSKHNINPILDAALKDMTQIMNLANSMAHFRNIDIVNETVLILKNNGINFSLNEFKICLVKNHNWKSDMAEEALKTVNKALEGKRHKYTTGRHYYDNVIEEWIKKSEHKN